VPPDACHQKRDPHQFIGSTLPPIFVLSLGPYGWFACQWEVRQPPPPGSPLNASLASSSADTPPRPPLSVRPRAPGHSPDHPLRRGGAPPADGPSRLLHRAPPPRAPRRRPPARPPMGPSRRLGQGNDGSDPLIGLVDGKSRLKIHTFYCCLIFNHAGSRMSFYRFAKTTDKGSTPPLSASAARRFHPGWVYPFNGLPPPPARRPRDPDRGKECRAPSVRVGACV